MNKRVIAKLNGGEEAELEGASRHKRRKETRGPSSDVDILMSDPSDSKGAIGLFSKAEVKEMGMQIWQTVKDAVKDGEPIAIPFLRKPSSRLYPDYYFVIKNPIALDDIKKRLNEGKYASMEDVRKDFELLFGNAKQYNQTESIIYQHAKELLKLVHKTYNKVVPDEDEDEKSKPPNLYKLLKARLDKVVSKKDSNDRVLSTEFIQLPSRKLWPIYYIEIQKPECFDNIYKRLKQKVYQSATEFAVEVELIFSNAMTFNQDGTQIFNDAVTLRDYFRLLMSDLPPPYSLPEYAKPVNKIRIRPVQATQTPTGALSRLVGKQEQSTTSLTLKVPLPQASTNQTANSAVLAQAQASAPPPATNASTLPVAPVIASRPSAPKAAPPQPAVKPTTPQLPAPTATAASTVSFINATPSHYPRPQTPHAQPVPGPSTIPPVAAPSTHPAVPTVNMTQTETLTPVSQIVYPLSRQLKSVSILIQPRSRRLTLDHRDGVKTWSVRLVPGETSLQVNEVAYMEEDDDEGSEDEHMDVDKDDNDSMDVDYAASPSRRKGKAKGRGRPPKAAKAVQSVKAAKTVKKKASRKLGEVQLRLNNFVVSEQPEKPGEWSLYLVSGRNIIEIGEAGGMIWKLYADRIAEA